jgi:hypothetical protein
MTDSREAPHDAPPGLQPPQPLPQPPAGAVARRPILNLNTRVAVCQIAQPPTAAITLTSKAP